VAAEDQAFRDVAARIQRLGGVVVAKGRPIVKPSPTAAPRKAAAQAIPGPAAARTGAAQPNDTPQKNRKIGFV
jgi:hypothetical protein